MRVSSRVRPVLVFQRPVRPLWAAALAFAVTAGCAEPREPLPRVTRSNSTSTVSPTPGSRGMAPAVRAGEGRAGQATPSSGASPDQGSSALRIPSPAPGTYRYSVRSDGQESEETRTITKTGDGWAVTYRDERRSVTYEYTKSQGAVFASRLRADQGGCRFSPGLLIGFASGYAGDTMSGTSRCGVLEFKTQLELLGPANVDVDGELVSVIRVRAIVRRGVEGSMVSTTAVYQIRAADGVTVRAEERDSSEGFPDSDRIYLLVED